MWMDDDQPLLIMLARAHPELRRPRVPLSPTPRPLKLYPSPMWLRPPEPYYADGAWQRRYTGMAYSFGVEFREWKK